MSDKAKTENLPAENSFKLKLPKSMEEFFLKVAGLFAFAFRFIKELFRPPYEFKESLKQFYEIGYKSFALIGITGFIIGLTLTLQSIPTLEK